MEKTLFMGFALSAKFALRDAISLVGNHCDKVAPIDETATEIIDDLTSALVYLQMAVDAVNDENYFRGDNK